jgi:transcriptional regulator with XRE-family HTH domain
VSSGFGSRLRAARKERGLTQGAVGGSAFSASYISLLESGEREPTRDVLRHLHRTLDIPLSEVQGWLTSASSGTAQLSLATWEAHQAWNHRHYEDSRAKAAAAAAAARDEGVDAIWWTMRLLEAESLAKLERYEPAEKVAEELRHHDLGRQSPGLLVPVTTFLSTVCRLQGRLEVAVRHGEAAERLAQETGAAPNQCAEAALVHVAALSESGLLDEAWDLSRSLREAPFVEDLPDSRRGLIEWAHANVAFARGDVQEGLAAHDRAAALLSPREDLESWFRFSRARALVRLRNGLADSTTRTLIDDAEATCRLLGATEHQDDIRELQARFSLLTGETDAGLLMLQDIVRSREAKGLPVSPDLMVLLAQSASRSGSDETARAYFLKAAKAFADAGNADRASAALAGLMDLANP